MKNNNFFVSMAGKALAIAAAVMMSMVFAACSKDNNDDNQELDYVDLGLSVKWAKCNIGADKPS